MKPFPNRTSAFQRIRLSPTSLPLRVEGIRALVHGRLVRPRRAYSPSLAAQALRPAAALPAAPVGRNPHGYYGLSSPVPALVISRPTIAGAGTGSGVARVASFMRL